MRAPGGLVALTLAGALSATALAAAEPVPPQPVKTETLQTEGTAAQVGQRLASLILAKFKGGLPGRLALGYPSDSAWLEPLTRGLAEALPGSVPLGDLGVSAPNAAEAFVQVDPASFAALVWIAPVVAKDGSIASLDVSCQGFRGQPPLRLSVICSSPLRGPAPPPPPGFERWAEAGGDVLALAWESGSGRLWADAGARLLRLDPATRKPEQSWDLPAPREGKARGPALLGYVVEDGKPARMGWYDLGGAEGRWYERGPDGFAPGATLEGLPLPDRVLRFFSASTQGPGSPLLISSYQNKDLCTCTQFARFGGTGAASFACKTPEGGIRVIRGDTLAVQEGPSRGAVAALAGAGALLLVASPEAPFTVKGYTLNPDHSWETSWASPLLPAAPTALCAGEIGGKPTLFAALPGGVLTTCPLPPPTP